MTSALPALPANNSAIQLYAHERSVAACNTGSHFPAYSSISRGEDVAHRAETRPCPAKVVKPAISIRMRLLSTTPALM